MSQSFPGQTGPPVGDLSVLIQGTRGEVNGYLIKAGREHGCSALAVVAVQWRRLCRCPGRWW
jgi:hypothetical protein